MEIELRPDADREKRCGDLMEPLRGRALLPIVVVVRMAQDLER